MAASLDEQLDRALRIEREAQLDWIDAARRGAHNHRQLWEVWDRRVEELHEIGQRVAEDAVAEQARARR